MILDIGIRSHLSFTCHVSNSWSDSDLKMSFFMHPQLHLGSPFALKYSRSVLQKWVISIAFLAKTETLRRFHTPVTSDTSPETDLKQRSTQKFTYALKIPNLQLVSLLNYGSSPDNCRPKTRELQGTSGGHTVLLLNGGAMPTPSQLRFDFVQLNLENLWRQRFHHSSRQLNPVPRDLSVTVLCVQPNLLSSNLQLLPLQSISMEKSLAPSPL